MVKKTKTPKRGRRSTSRKKPRKQYKPRRSRTTKSKKVPRRSTSSAKKIRKSRVTYAHPTTTTYHKPAPITKSYTWKDRLELFENVTSNLENHPNGAELCPVDDRFGDMLALGPMFSTQGVAGAAFRGKTLEDGVPVAFKQLPITLSSDLKSMFGAMKNHQSVWVETSCYMFTTIMVLSRICPNLPIMYKFFLCSHDRPHPSLWIVTELADGDMQKYLSPPYLSRWNWALVENCMFQIMAGLYTMQKYYSMRHNDLHWGNVLVFEVRPGGCWEYKIDDSRYYVPNMGFLFVLWDFGRAHVPGMSSGFYGSESRDISWIAQIVAEDTRTLDVPLMDELRRAKTSNINFQQAFKKYYGHYNSPKGQVLETYNMDVKSETLKNVHPEALYGFLR